MNFEICGFEFSIRRKQRPPRLNLGKFQAPYKLHIGPGPNWVAPDQSWISVDVDPKRGDMIIDFQDFVILPLDDNSVAATYGSHVFEHISIHTSNLLFAEIFRTLMPGGVLRMVLPDVRRSINAYISEDINFELFKRRTKRARETWDKVYTPFDCLREDFLSRALQPQLLGSRALAHQNAWDFESLKNELALIGFEVVQVQFQESQVEYFQFEGTFPSEANESDRSLYVEATKPQQ